jgi:hypothetical protein
MMIKRVKRRKIRRRISLLNSKKKILEKSLMLKFKTS